MIRSNGICDGIEALIDRPQRLGGRQDALVNERLQPDGLQRESGRYNTAGDVIQDGLQES